MSTSTHLLDAPRAASISKRGGARPGAGRKPKGSRLPTAEIDAVTSTPRGKTGPKPVQSPKLDSFEAGIVEDMLNGVGYRSIASKHGVGVGTLVAWISANTERSRACAHAREQSARLCDEQAEFELRAAADPFELQRAKELAAHLRWRAKTRNPKEFGDRVAVDAKVEVSFEDRLLALSAGPVRSHAKAPPDE